MECCWQQVLASLSLLLDASTDEGATEIILKSVETMVGLSGRLGLTLPRDAFIMALCKAALPSNYGAMVLGQAAVCKNQVRHQQHQPQQPVPPGDDNERSQVSTSFYVSFFLNSSFLIVSRQLLVYGCLAFCAEIEICRE